MNKPDIGTAEVESFAREFVRDIFEAYEEFLNENGGTSVYLVGGKYVLLDTKFHNTYYKGTINMLRDRLTEFMGLKEEAN